MDAHVPPVFESKKILPCALKNLKKSKKKKVLIFYLKQKTQYEQRNREKSENHIGTNTKGTFYTLLTN